MTAVDRLEAWQALVQHHHAVAHLHMRSLFAHDAQRFDRFSGNLGSLLVDYSKNRITLETQTLLLDLARQCGLEDWRHRLLSGERINTTEQRAALHTALRNRSGQPVMVDGHDIMPEVSAVLAQMRTFSEALRHGTWQGATGHPIRDVVNVGIGGSHLGPAMVCRALTPYHHDTLRAHFVSNVDGSHLASTLRQLDPRTTLFVVASKTFTTQETMANADLARAWLTQALGEQAVSRHFVALSSNSEAVRAFGIDTANMFRFWDWVGGRYSVWSAIGLPVAVMVGMDAFEDMLAGGHAVDRHFQDTPLEHNLPVLLALIDIWNIGFLGARAQAVLPYDQHLSDFPAYLQQAVMESNGKSVTRHGEAIDYATAPIVFGQAGTNGQHSFHQLLHQGSHLVPCDFIAPVRSHNPLGNNHRLLLSNMLAQAEALMCGRTVHEVEQDMATAGDDAATIAALAPHRVFAGNRPSNTLLVERIDPHTLGQLIALYEHRIFVQGVIWHINSFDQWGVELGKQLAGDIEAALAAADTVQADELAHRHDVSTAGLIAHIRRTRTPPEAP